MYIQKTLIIPKRTSVKSWFFNLTFREFSYKITNIKLFTQKSHFYVIIVLIKGDIYMNNTLHVGLDVGSTTVKI